jgi:hypothetical protein
MHADAVIVNEWMDDISLAREEMRAAHEAWNRIGAKLVPTPHLDLLIAERIRCLRVYGY